MDMAALILTLTHTLAKVLFPVPLICWSTGLSSKGRNAPTRKYSSDATNPEVKKTIWPPWDPHASESIGEVGSYCPGWGYWSCLARGHGLSDQLWILSRTWRKKDHERSKGWFKKKKKEKVRSIDWKSHGIKMLAPGLCFLQRLSCCCHSQIRLPSFPFQKGRSRWVFK